MNRSFACAAGLSALSLLWLGSASARGQNQAAAPAAAAAAPVDPKQQAFEALLSELQQKGDSATEAQILKVFEQARELGQPLMANLATKLYFARNAKPSVQVLKAAAENAVLAADYRTAVTRYKLLLQAAGNGPEASDAAGQLFLIQLDFLAAGDDAFQSMKQYGDKLRQSPLVLKFDSWFVQEAMRRGDAAACAERLATVLAEKMPLERERLYFWEGLDWLTRTVSQAKPAHFNALNACKKITPLIREGGWRTSLFALVTANLEFAAGSAGKEQATLDQNYDKVAASAREYFAAHPNTQSLQNILVVFTGGFNTCDWNVWSRQVEQKRQVVLDSLAKLPDAQRLIVADYYQPWGGLMHAQMFTPMQWVDVLAKYPAIATTSRNASALNLPTQLKDLAAYKAAAAGLAGSTIPAAATINSVAVYAGDYKTSLAHLMQKEAWHRPFSEVYNDAYGRVWTDLNALPDAEKGALCTAQQALIALGDEYLSKNPVAVFNVPAVAAYLQAAFLAGAADANDKSAFAARLQGLDWVPYTQAERTAAVAPAYEEFKRWTESLRQAKQRDAASVPDAVLAQVSPLEDAFKASSKVAITDVAKAPNPTCKLTAEAVLALQQKKAPEYLVAARALYAQFRDAQNTKAPHGRAILDFILSNHLEAFDTLDFQCEALADQLSTFQPEGANYLTFRLLELMVTGRPNFSFFASAAAGKDSMVKINNVLAKAMKDQLAKNQYSPRLFYYFRGSRAGTGWRENGLNEDVLATMIKSKTLLAATERVTFPSAAASYQWLILAEFPNLRTAFPPETYFDDMFVEEATKTRKLDWAYWNYGRDQDLKVRKCAAAIMGDFASLPFGYANEELTYSRGDFWNWQAQVLGVEPALRDAMLAKIEAAYGKTRFDSYAMGRGYFVNAVAKDAASRKDFFSHLAAYAAKAAQEPERVGPPYMAGLAGVDPASLSDEELKALVSLFPMVAAQPWPGGWHYESLAALIHQALVKRGDYKSLYAVIPYFWAIARDTSNVTFQRQLAQYVKDLGAQKQAAAASTYSASGLELLATKTADDVRTILMAMRAKAIADSGAAIPVPASDPRYPIYAAQVAFLNNKYDIAWDHYMTRRELVPALFKELDPSFSIWVIDRNSELRLYDEAETLAKQLIKMADDNAGAFEPETRARMLLAFADIFFAREDYPRARAQYERIAAAGEFAGTRSRAMAELKIVDVDRKTRQYDAAISALDKLMRRPDKFIQTQAHYQMAQVLYDQKDYSGASEQLDMVFLDDPGNEDARILQGEVNNMLKRYDRALDIQVGPSEDKRLLIPGKPVKISLQDANRAVVRTSEHIEVKVWTKSGDFEEINLLPMGDDKTKFQGELPTQLGNPVKGNHLLEVVGLDEVYYDYSDKFRKNMKDDEANYGAPPALRVVSDSEIFASSGRILSKQEQEEKRMEDMIRSKLRMNEDFVMRQVLSAQRPANQIKPGNKINVRIIDLDRDVSNQKDKAPVKITARSGDELIVDLLETEEHSGVFEGQIPTASGQATAYASDSQDGRDPNFAVSAQNHPAWVGRPDNVRPKIFSVDLNDNVALSEMKIVAGEAGRKLKDFLIQTSINGRDFTTVGSYPRPYEAWDGSLAIEAVKLVGPVPTNLVQFKDYLDHGYISKGLPKVSGKASSLKNSWDAGVMGMAGPMQLGADWFVAHIQGAFYLPQSRVYAFKVDPKGRTQNVGYLLAIDGDYDERRPLEFRHSLKRGVHRLDLYICAHRNANPAFDVLRDIDKPPYMESMPASLFDAKNADIRAEVFTPPAVVKVSDDGGSFDIGFGPRTQARVVRLLLNDFEQDAPSIKKIMLVDTKSRQILPTANDFMSLRTNQTLEMVPGDRLAVTYDDPNVVTESRRSQDVFLTATYANAEISACFVDYEIDLRTKERKPKYYPMRRFAPGDKINVFISDPDRDISDEQDKIAFRAMVAGTGEVELEALETETHSGVFVGSVFPILGAPQRPSELTVKEGELVTLKYEDRENTDPGIPWIRTFEVEQTWNEAPQLRAYELSTRALDEKEMGDVVKASRAQGRQVIEVVPASRAMVASRPEKVEADKPSTLYIDGPLIAEVLFPTIAQSPLSVADLYIQTSAGRQMAGVAGAPDSFDVNVPGTIHLKLHPSELMGVESPEGYKEVLIRGDAAGGDALDEGRFLGLVPYELSPVPPGPVPDPKMGEKQEPLSIKGDDTIFLGFKYKDAKTGAEGWVTQAIALKSDIFLDVMDRRYQDSVTSLHVGENLYLRVINKVLDVTDDKDAISMDLVTAGGHNTNVQLTETFGHSGIFKGVVKLAYVNEPQAVDGPGQLMVAYGDQITCTYRPSQGEPMQKVVNVYKGADGEVIPFTKRFKDPQIAVDTQFTVAEAYFELAKRHRELQQDDVARREIAQGKKLLEEAIRDYPDTDARAQADYLLANLSYEFAKDAANADIKKNFNLEAVSRFTDIVATYPESPYAPKSQYKKALVLEQMGQIDDACEEYVKLSYRYPDNELVAETIARLGQYFLAKGKVMADAMAGEADPVKRERIKLDGFKLFKTAGEVFGRLSERFPSHALAGKTLVLSAQCFMRAEEFEKAIEGFKRVYMDTKADNELAAESLYWAGDCSMKQKDYLNAYRTFKKLTWDYPESKWAKYARGRLTDESLVQVGEQDAGN